MGIYKSWGILMIDTLPIEWEIDVIKNHCKITTGSKNTQDAVKNGDYPFFVRSQIIERINSFSFDGEAILTAGDGVGVGKVFHYFNGKFDYHQRVYNMSNFSDRLNGKFFYLYFKNNFDKQVQVGSAKTSVDSVRLEMISLMKLPLPPYKEQQKIAKILTTVDDSIESANKIIAKQKRVKTALMQDLLTCGIDENGNIRSEATHKFKDSPLGRIPEEWDCLNFENNIELIDGDRGSNYPNEKELFKDGYCLFLSAKNVTKNGFKFINKQFISKQKDIKLGKGKLALNDIILTTRGTVGNVALYNTKVHFSNLRINSGMLIIRLKVDRINVNFLYLLFESRIIKNQIESVVFGSAQPQLTVKEIEKFKLIFPKSKDEQQKITNILAKQDEAIEQEEQKLKKLQSIKKALMQDLLTGKVRVNYE
jgi:type I restriction enzyme S subunit